MEPKYGIMTDDGLISSDVQLEGYKPLVFAPIPDFDQEQQMVLQEEPVDMGDHIYLGVEIFDLPPYTDEDGNDMW